MAGENYLDLIINIRQQGLDQVIKDVDRAISRLHGQRGKASQRGDLGRQREFLSDTREVADAKTEGMVRGAIIERDFASDSARGRLHQQALMDLTAAQQRLKAKVQEKVATETDTAKWMVRERVAREQIAADAARLARRPQRVGDVSAVTAAADRRYEEDRNRILQEQKVLDRITPADTRSRANLRFSQQEQAAAEEASLLRRRQTAEGEALRLQETRNKLSREAMRIEDETNALRRKLQSGIAQQEAQRDFAKRQYDTSRETAFIAQMDTPEGRWELTQQGLVRAGQARQKALRDKIDAEARAVDEEYIRDTAATAASRREQKARIDMATAGEDSFAFDDGSGPRALAGEELEARAALAQRARANRMAAHEAALTSQADIRASVEAKVQRARLNQAMQMAERAYIREAVASGQIGPGTRFQRLQARFSPTGRVPEEFQTLGQFTGSKIVTTAGYALGGAAAYGAFSGLSTMLREAAELDEILNQIDAQLRSIGQGEYVGEVRAEILDIARDTGVAADEVGSVAFQLIGAFSQDGGVPKAMAETRDAMKLTRVTGLELAEVTDSLIATTKTYGVTMQDVGDIAIYVEQQFGVLARETIAFLGDTAAVANTAGLGLEEFAIIAGAAQQASGRSGAAIGEGLNRILPAIQDNSSEILSLYTMLREQSGQAGSDSALAFSQGYDNVLSSMSRGLTGEAFLQIIRDFDAMSKAQQNAIITQLGGRREAQTLIPILEQSKRIISEIDALESGDESQVGLMNQRFMNFEETVQNAGARLRETFMQIGEVLFESGIAEGLVVIMDGLQGITSLGLGLVGVFESIDKAIPNFGMDKGLLLTMGQFALLAFTMQKAFGLLAGVRAKDAAASLGQAGAQQQVNMGLTQGVGVNRAYMVSTQQKTAAIQQNTVAATVNNRATMGARISGAFPSFSDGRAVYGAHRGAGVGPVRSFGHAAGAAGSGMMAVPAAGQGMAVAGIATAGGFMVYSQYQTIRSDLAKAEEDLRAKMSQANREDLKKIAETRTGFWARMGLTLFGQDLPEDIAQQELTSQDAAPYAARLSQVVDLDRAGQLADAVDGNAYVDFLKENREALQVTRGTMGSIPGAPESWDRWVAEKLPEELPEIIRRATEEGDEGAKQILEFLAGQLDRAEDLATLRRKVDEALESEDTQKALEEAGGISELIALKVSELKAKRDAGYASDRQVIQGSIQILEETRRTATSFAGVGGLSPEQLEELAAAEREVMELILGDVSDRASSYERLARVDPGGVDARSQDLEARLATLATSPNLSGAGRDQLIDQWIQLLDERFERELAGIADEELRALREQEGYEIPEGLRALLVESELGLSDEFVGFLEPLSSALGIRQDEISADIARVVADTDLSVREALLNYINAQLAALTVAGGSSDVIKALEDQRSRVLAAPEINVSEFERIYSDNIDSLKDAKKKEDDYWDGYYDYLMALAEGNPEAEAAVRVQQAARQLEEAETPGERLAAQAAMIRAQRQVTEARNDVVRAQLETARVLADGDPIRETEASLRLAAFELQVAAGRGDRAAVERARAEIISLNQQQRDNFVDIQRANLEFMAASSTDPLEQARWAIAMADFDVANARGAAERVRAEISAMEARRQEQEALVDIQRARMEYSAALVANDPIAAAQEAVKQADFEFANARGEAARIRAQAQQIQANQQLKMVIQDLVYAQIELAQAFAEAAGEGVDVARFGLQAALQRLKDARENGLGQAAILRAQAGVVQAQAALRDAEFSDRLGDIDFLLQIGDITTAQAIQMLESLAQIPDLTEEQLRQIRLKIKSLQDDISSNFQFNLPTNLRLPTLYEARRLDQSSSQGIGYQDNRTVDIRIQVNNGADEERMISILDDALSNRRFGSTPGRY